MYNKLLDEYFSSKLLEFEMLYIDEYKKKYAPYEDTR